MVLALAQDPLRTQPKQWTGQRYKHAWKKLRKQQVNIHSRSYKTRPLCPDSTSADCFRNLRGLCMPQLCIRWLTVCLAQLHVGHLQPGRPEHRLPVPAHTLAMCRPFFQLYILQAFRLSQIQRMAPLIRTSTSDYSVNQMTISGFTSFVTMLHGVPTANGCGLNCITCLVACVVLPTSVRLLQCMSVLYHAT